MRLIQGPSDTWGHVYPRTCDARCYNAKGPVCNCVCDGMNHGVGEREAVFNTKERYPYWQPKSPFPIVLQREARPVFQKGAK